MFEKILFATSATPACDPAARVAFDLAHRYGSHLHIFHVLGVPTRGYSQLVIDIKTGEKVEVDDDYLAWVKEEVSNYYEALIKKVEGRNEISVAVGLPHREILRAAKEIKPDLIIMGGSTGGPQDSIYKKVIPGSTFQRVARAAPYPVLVVSRPAASFWGGFSRILLSVDFSKATDTAFEYAKHLAAGLSCELFFFHALDITSSPLAAMEPQDEIERRLQIAYRRIRSSYAVKVGDIREYSIDVWEGIPYVEIVKYAREKHVDLIVMSHNAGSRDLESSPGGLGRTMEQVIVRAGCPVVSINRLVHHD